MPVKTYNAEFWLWYLQETFEEFTSLYDGQSIITNAENVFSSTKKPFDITINLNEEKCFDSEDGEFSLVEYIALKQKMKRTELEIHLDVEFESWKGDQKEHMAKRQYVRQVEHYCWSQRNGDVLVPVTEFDVILQSVIEKWNMETQAYDKYYAGKVRYLKYGRPVDAKFELTPSQTHSVDEFSKAMWQIDNLIVKNLKNEQMRVFWFHVDLNYKPRVIREYDHYGFIDFEGEKFFLGENVLIRFPKTEHEEIKLIGIKEGSFPVGNNKYIKPPSDAIHLPHLELGVLDSKSGTFKKATNLLYDQTMFEQRLKEVEKHFCGMVGGDSEFGEWGKLLLAYVFSYVYFDEIYDHLKHVIFIYLYGEGNVGKGEVAKRILDFFGINYLDSLNTPPARSVDTALQQKSKIPQWIDEHVPQVPGQNAKIDDQIWNSWFELKPRPTNMMKKNSNSWGTERKEVRTMPLFCSNFKPQSDHLLSRSLIIEYRKSTRGPEEHLRWLKSEKQQLQFLLISFLKNYNKLDRDLFVWDIDRFATRLKDDVKAALKKRNVVAVLQDRQISQFATLITVYHWMWSDYRNLLAENQPVIIEHENAADSEIDKQFYKNVVKSLDTHLDNKLYDFIKYELIKTSIQTALHDPLTEYIETIATLIQAGKVTEYHFNWTKEGVLKIWSKGIWDEYEAAKRNTDGMVRRDVVEEKLRHISDVDKHGQLKTINWSITYNNEDQRVKGFYIKDAVHKELFRIAFKWHKYRPNHAKDFGYVKNEEPQNNVDDDLPF